MPDDYYGHIDQALDDRRLELGLNWNEVANRAHIGMSTLVRFRKGEGVRSKDTTRKIEVALGMERGSLAALADQEEPPDPEPEGNDLGSVVDDLQASVDDLQAQVRDLKRRLA